MVNQDAAALCVVKGMGDWRLLWDCKWLRPPGMPLAVLPFRTVLPSRAPRNASTQACGHCLR